MKQKNSIKSLCVLLGFICTNSFAQTATVTLTSEKQVIRGFGGINHPSWYSDLNANERALAFGNGTGQLGFTVLRTYVSEKSSEWGLGLQTAQYAYNQGAYVFATPWNPPAGMSIVVNGVKRINPATYAQYADHLNSYVTYMKNNKVNLYAISVQNEPDYAAEWTAWSPQEGVDFLKGYRSRINCKMMTPESFQYLKNVYDPILNDATALANVDIFGTHLYGTQYSNFPYPLFTQKGAGKELWMTEVYTDSKYDGNIWSDTYINDSRHAIKVAEHIHYAMTDGNFQAYVFWPLRRYYALIHDGNSDNQGNTAAAAGTATKRGYCMAQFSKFVRPGYVRVDATKQPVTNVFVSAYKKGSDVSIVVVNKNTTSKTLTISVPGTTVTSWDQYTTTASKNIAKGTAINASTSLQVTLEPSSVTTFVGVGTTACTPPVAPTVTSSTVTYCQGAIASQLAATGTALKWYTTATGGTSSAVAPTPSATTSGSVIYYVSQTVSNCESDRTAITVTVNANPAATITASGATTFCQNAGNVTLSAPTGTGLTYQWKNGTNNTGVGNATHAIYYTSGSYSVEITSDAGCKATSNSIVVTVNPAPSVPTITGDSVMCNGRSVLLTSSATTGNQWLNGTVAINAATSSTLNVSAIGKYSTTVTTANGCKSSSKSVNVTNNINCTVTSVDGTEMGSEQATVFPNPFTNDGLKINKNGDYKYELDDMYGVKLVSGNANGAIVIGKELLAGTYFLTLTDSSNVITHKVIKR